MKVEVYNKEGKATGDSVELSDVIFGLETVNKHAIYLDVRQTQANKRQGTHKTKERGEVSGSTKKPFRQKGTGGARAGHKRSPLWRHGGTVFGPRPRDYGFKLNKKLKRIAKMGALTLKAREEKIKVLDGLNMDKPKTKEFVQILSNLQLGKSKTLFVAGPNDSNLYLSSRNFPGVKVVQSQELSTYDILNSDTLVLLKDSIELIENNLKLA